MILVVGGIASGKCAFVQSLGYPEDEISPSLESAAPVLVDVQEVLRTLPAGSDIPTLAERIAACKRVVVLVDVGSGIVPLDPDERAWRDRVGSLARELAARADAVVRMVCGIPSYLKGSPEACVENAPAEASSTASVQRLGNLAEAQPAASAQRLGNLAEDRGTVPAQQVANAAETPDGVEVVIMRHGTSTYNEERRYAGWTDVPLSLKGIREAQAAGICPQVTKVFVSPLLRARQTAQICFPNAEQVVVDGLQEMNFGDFEGRTAAEMEDDAAYRAWVDGMCTGRCPNGEGPSDMIARMEQAVGDVVRMAKAAGERRAIIVAHGGTIMAALTGVTGDGSDYFGWQVGNCEGYRATVIDDGDHLRYTDKVHFPDLGFLVENADDAPEQPSWKTPESFFQNRSCKYFPCHEGVPEDEFNCLFCYCPLYALGPACGGDFTYTEKGRKNCTGCVRPHLRDCGVKLVFERYEMLADLASI